MKQSKHRVAVYSGTDNILEDIFTSIKSLMANSAVDRIYVMVDGMNGWEQLACDGFPFLQITPLDMHDQIYFKSDGPNMKSPYSHMSLLRAALADIFRNKAFDEILSLDYDILVMHDCTDIWDIDVRGNFFAASMEPERTVNGLLYTNTGVALHNMKLERAMGFTQACIHALNVRQYTWVDQDVMNYIGQGRIVEMPSTFNANPWTEPVTDPKIMHYAGWKRAGWDDTPDWQMWREMSWKDVMESHKYIREVHQDGVAETTRLY